MKRLIELIKDQFDDVDIKIGSASIISELDGFDSLTAFSIIDAIEEEYGVQIDESNLNMSIEELNKLLLNE